MDRKEFLQGCCAMVFLTSLTGNTETSESPNDANLKFIQNWVSDLMETLDSDFPEEQKIKLMDGCGRGCYRRFTWKQDIAAKGKGSPEKLIEALKANFEVWREGSTVHIRYGAVNSYGCYCPAAKYRPGKSKDIHCYCTRAMHQAIWEAALGKKPQIDILQSVRRGDPTCHFLVHLA